MKVPPKDQLDKLEAKHTAAMQAQLGLGWDGSGYLSNDATSATLDANLGSAITYASMDAREFSLTAQRMHRTNQRDLAKKYHMLAWRAHFDVLMGLAAIRGGGENKYTNPLDHEPPHEETCINFTHRRSVGWARKIMENVALHSYTWDDLMRETFDGQLFITNYGFVVSLFGCEVEFGVSGTSGQHGKSSLLTWSSECDDVEIKHTHRNDVTHTEAAELVKAFIEDMGVDGQTQKLIMKSNRHYQLGE